MSAAPVESHTSLKTSLATDHRSVPDPVTDSEIQSLLATSPTIYCPLDPIPTWLLKELAPYMVPVIRHICNLSLQTGSFSTALKQALVQPRVKNPTLVSK